MTGERPRRPRLAVLSRRGPLILSRNHQFASDETLSRPNRLSVSQEDLVIEVRPASAGILRSFDGGSGALPRWSSRSCRTATTVSSASGSATAPTATSLISRSCRAKRPGRVDPTTARSQRLARLKTKHGGEGTDTNFVQNIGGETGIRIPLAAPP